VIEEWQKDQETTRNAQNVLLKWNKMQEDLQNMKNENDEMRTSLV
jgi:hypothetical protein